jgi:hypothetical protein
MAGVAGWDVPASGIKATGRRTYYRTFADASGFARGHRSRHKVIREFQTGDMLGAQVPAAKKAGAHAGRVAVRETGSLKIQTSQGLVQGIRAKHYQLVRRGEGYGYRSGASSSASKAGCSAPGI